MTRTPLATGVVLAPLAALAFGVTTPMVHRHEPLAHDHEHAPDLHHAHDHG